MNKAFLFFLADSCGVWDEKQDNWSNIGKRVLVQGHGKGNINHVLMLIQLFADDRLKK